MYIYIFIYIYIYYWSSSVARSFKQLKDGLLSIDKCPLTAKNKLWCVYFGLILRLAWVMQIRVYEVLLSRIEKIERLISQFQKKWLGVPKSLTNVALYSSSTKLKLPKKSFVKEFELGKAWRFQMLRDSEDPLVKSAQPAITDRKWNAKYAVETAESSLTMKKYSAPWQLGELDLVFTHNGGGQKRPQE